MAVKNSLATRQNKKIGITAYLTNDAVKDQINKVIGGKNGQRFIAAIVSAVNNNPALQECTNQSILSGALLGESLNLSPSPQLGHYYLVPFKDKERGKVATFQLGYKGIIQLAIRSGQYKRLNVLAIKEGELIRFDPLNEEIEVRLIEDEEEREQAPTAGYYAMFEYVNGFKKAIYWSKKRMEAHALKYSSGYAADKRNKNQHTFWSKDFDGMAYKTMLRQLITKWGIMSIDMVTALDGDMAVINADGSHSYVENEELQVVEAEEPEAPQEADPEVPGKSQVVKEAPTVAAKEDFMNPPASADSVEDALFG